MPMENKELLEMEGSVENIVYHNDSNQYTVLEINSGEELVTVVGTFPYISVGEKLHLYGTWTSHATFGQQFKSEAFEEENFEDAIREVWEAIEKYDPSIVGFAWDKSNPRIQLEPIGARGYIELLPVKEI